VAALLPSESRRRPSGLIGPRSWCNNLPQPEDLPPSVEPPRPISVTFLPATVFNNPILLRANPEYYAWLLSLPTLEREAAARRQLEDPPGRRALFQARVVRDRRRGPGRPRRLCATGISPLPKRPSSTIPIGRSASSFGRDIERRSYWLVDMMPHTGPTQGDVERLLPQYRRAGRQRGSASASDRIRDRPAKARHFTWCVPSAPTPPGEPRRGGDKLTRFGPFSSQCRAGNVKIRRGAWNEELFRVLEGFPDLAARRRSRCLQRSPGNAQSQFERPGAISNGCARRQKKRRSSDSQSPASPITPSARCKWEEKTKERESGRSRRVAAAEE